MGGNTFSFKRFTIDQSGVAMKVGVDGVLLGAWAAVDISYRRILDIGTGTGLLALMTAQRMEQCGAAMNRVSIDAIDIDVTSCVMARANVDASHWRDHINVIHTSFQDHVANEHSPIYDSIISNPPYFVNSLLPSNKMRSTARHAITLPHMELLQGVARILAPHGIFSVILPCEGGVHTRFLESASAIGLGLHRQALISPKRDSSPNRVMMELRHGFLKGETKTDLIAVEESGRHQYSEEYVSYTRDFYLKF